MNVKEKIETVCLECGVSTLRQPCHSARKFCDRKCASIFNQRARQKREVKPCSHCKVDFESLVCHSQSYCSRECSDQGRRIRVELTCTNCGSAYERHTKKATQSRYCGNACKQEAGAARRASSEMSEAEYEQRLESQGGVCAICKLPEEQTWRRGEMKIIKLTRDHNHKTGEWRGLLCRKCNMAIGLMQDDVPSLLRAADYVLTGGMARVAQ